MLMFVIKYFVAVMKIKDVRTNSNETETTYNVCNIITWVY